MKNIHVLPTDKARLYIHQGKLYDNKKTMHIPDGTQIPHHIYITNDKEIKESDWFIQVNTNKVIKEHPKNGLLIRPQIFDKKIILTTDPDLIKGDVQAIDDIFLEWFVKNPSCESVKTDLVPVNYFGSEITVNSYGFDKFIYKIIIPQEEPKQETIEEFANKYYKDPFIKTGILVGAKWQAERMYSEEEVYKLLLKHQSDYRSSVRNSYPLTWSFDIKKWFEQFKKN